MTDRDREIWRRRLITSLTVGFAIAMAISLALAGDDDPAAEEATTQPTSLALRADLTRRRDRGIAVRYATPDDWKVRKKASVLRMRAPDRSVAITISSPAPAESRQEVLQTALAAIRDGYGKVEAQRGHGRKVGNLEARGAVIETATRKGVDLRILAAAAKSKRRTYLVLIFSAADAPAARLAEAQNTLETLRFRR